MAGNSHPLFYYSIDYMYMFDVSEFLFLSQKCSYELISVWL